MICIHCVLSRPYLWISLICYILVFLFKRIDKASMLDEVIEYLKQLQAQVKAMSRMVHVNMPPSPMMLPNMALQQLQMSMMGLARPMDVNALNRSNITTMPSVPHPAAPSNFNMPMPSPGASFVPDPLATFLPAAQSQVGKNCNTIKRDFYCVDYIILRKSRIVE